MTSVSQYTAVAFELDRLHARVECLEGALREIIATYLAAAEFTGLYEGRLGVLAEASRNMAHIASGAINDQ